jgi:hypothetical protein
MIFDFLSTICRWGAPSGAAALIVSDGQNGNNLRIIVKNTVFSQKIKNRTLTRVSPPPLWLPQNAIIPEQVLRHHRDKYRGGMGGQEQSPLSSFTRCSLDGCYFS